jgi:hypothetical protein
LHRCCQGERRLYAGLQPAGNRDAYAHADQDANMDTNMDTNIQLQNFK